MKRKIDNFIEKNQKRIIDDIAKLVEFKSIESRPKDINDALDFVLKKAKDMGFKTMMTSKKDVGIVEIGQGSETIGVLVHVDVVDIGDIKKWTNDPFECVERDGYLWGRGVADDKGPVIMCLYAMKAIVDLEIKLNKKIWLIVGTSEEGQWTDIETFKEEFPVPNYGFSPDGDFPIYNIEKGYADVELSFEEPRIEELEVLKSGDSVNTVPSKAEIKIKNEQIRVFQGISAHSSVPEQGDNAIEKMCWTLADKRDFNFIRFANDYLVKDYEGKALNIDGESNYNDKLGSTTITPTVLEIKGNKVKMNINIRQKVGVHEKDIKKAFQKVSEEYSFNLEVVGCEDGMVVDEEIYPLQVMKSVSEEYGCDGSFKMAKGSSYAKTMKNFVSWGPIFPGDPSTAHMEDERMSLGTMILATKIYALYLARIASGKEKKSGIADMTSIDKALYILNIFAEEPYNYSIADIVKLTGINRTTVYRNIMSLVDFGLLMKDLDGKSYTLGPATYKMGNVYLNNGDDKENTLKILEKIANETRASVGLARREGEQVLSIHAVESNESIRMNDRPGTFYPMNKGTYGKCLMAFHENPITKEILDKKVFEKTGPNTLVSSEEILEEYENIRKNGFAISIEETFPSIIGVGIPLKSHDGMVRNVVAVSFFKQENYEDRIKETKEILFKYKKELEIFLR